MGAEWVRCDMVWQLVKAANGEGEEILTSLYFAGEELHFSNDDCSCRRVCQENLPKLCLCLEVLSVLVAFRVFSSVSSRVLVSCLEAVVCGRFCVNLAF